MSQVTGRFTSVEARDRIKEVFFAALADLRNEGLAEEFFEAFFTATEKINLPKRFGVFLLLAKGESYETIERKLKVSKPTIASVQKQVLTHGLEGMRKTIDKVLAENKPEQEHDPDPTLLRGRRLHRRQGIKKPYRNLPY